MSVATRLLVLVLLALVSSCGRSLAPTAPDRSPPDRFADAGPPEPVSSGDPVTGDAPIAISRIPPTVTITSPAPSNFFLRNVPTDVTIQWRMEDPDGPGPGVKSYRYLLLERDADDRALEALLDPNGFVARYAPRFEEWTPVDGMALSVDLHGLKPSSVYVFLITAIDRRGGYDAVFTTTKNILVMYATDIVPDPAGNDTETVTRTRTTLPR